MVGPDETRELDSVPASAGRNTAISARESGMPTTVQELALHERAALDFDTQPDEERRHRVEVVAGDPHMVERPDV